MRKNVIIVSVDNLRFDCFGASGERRWLEQAGLAEKLETPTLDRLAAESVVFTNAFSTATYTTAAHASLFTGLYPPKNGVRSFFGHRLCPELTTLAEWLRRNSYRTFFMSDNPSLFELTGLTRGFTDRARDEEELIEALFRTAAVGNVFAFAHFFDVHDPYLFSPGAREGAANLDYFERLRAECAAHGIAFDRGDHQRSYYELFYRLGGDRSHFFPWYVEGVNKFDQGRLARFIERLERRLDVKREWVLVVLSDHGEGRVEADDPERFRHEGLLYDEVLRIVFMLRCPQERARRVSDLVSLVDVFPTVLALAGVEELPDEGRDLDGMVVLAKGHRSIYAEAWRRRRKSLFSSFDNESFLRQRAVRGSDEKIVLNGRPEVFLADGGEDKEVQKEIERALLCRFEDEEKSSLGGGRKACEWRASKAVQVFDLRADPFEDQPLDLGSLDAQRSARALCALGEIGRIEAKAVLAPELGLFDALARRVSAIVDFAGEEPLAIWGAGEHTRMLFAKTPIARAKIAALVDSDEAKWGKTVEGFDVESPRVLAERRLAGVIVSSHAFEEEIFEAATRDLGIEPARVFRLYDNGEDRPGEYSPEEEASVARQLEELGYL